ncbi:MAG: ABC transporter permease [Chloroflexi bacterium]|nr:ABC transporter permease [Chloroflexota bacterium]
MLRLFVANLRIILRNRQGLFWALVFPLIFVTIFGLFKFDDMGSSGVAVIDQAQDNVSRALVENLKSIKFLRVTEEYTDEATARQKLQEAGDDVDFVLVLPRGLEESLRSGDPKALPAKVTLVYDKGNIQSSQLVIGTLSQFLQQTNMELVQAPELLKLQPVPVQARQVKYFDFLLPGFVGMGVMNYAIISMASTLAVWREQKIFKRILATPLSVRSFFIAQVLAQLLLSVVQAVVIILAGVLLFRAHIYGNVAWVFPIVVLGNIIFLNLGFLVATVAKNLNAANGLANVVAMPMMFFSGVFFPTNTLPGVMAEAVRYLPLTPMLNVMRGVVTYAQVPWDWPVELAILVGWVVLTSVAVVRFFRFD